MCLGTDKWHHFVAIAALTYPLTVASRRHWILIVASEFSFGGLIGFSLGVVVHNLKLKSAVWDGS